jgi:hypothetical protein
VGGAQAVHPDRSAAFLSVRSQDWPTGASPGSIPLRVFEWWREIRRRVRTDPEWRRNVGTPGLALAAIGLYLASSDHHDRVLGAVIGGIGVVVLVLFVA